MSNLTPSHQAPTSKALIGLFILAFLYTLYFAKAILLPIIITILLYLILMPISRVFKKLKIPASLSALIIVLILLFAIGYGFYWTSSTVNQWLTKAPQNFSQMTQKIELLIGPIEKPIKGFTLIKEQIEKTTQITPKSTQEIIVKHDEGKPYHGFFTATGVFFAQLSFMIFLLYFLLASGDFLLAKIVTIMPSLQEKKEAVTMAREISREINGFLLVKTVTGICLAIVITGIFFSLHMPNAALWGILAAILEFFPYIGVTVGTVLVTVAAMLAYDNLMQILLIPIVFFTAASVTGNFFVPLILSRTLTLHPVIVFTSVVFGGWLWGFAGALIAVPMLSIIKIICNNIRSLSIISKFMED